MKKLLKIFVSVKRWFADFIQGFSHFETVTDMSKDDLHEIIDKVIHKEQIQNEPQISLEPIKITRKWAKRIGIVAFLVISFFPAKDFYDSYVANMEKNKAITTLNNVAEKMYYEENAVDIALNVINKSLKLDSKRADTVYLKSFIESMQTVELLANLDRPYNQKELSLSQTALANAQSILESKDKEQFSKAYLIKAQSYYALNEYEKAIENINLAIKFDSDTAFYQIRKAIILIEEGEKKEDLDLVKKGKKILKSSFDKSTDIEKKWIFTYLAISNIYLNNEQSTILENFKKAIDIDPKFHIALFNKAKYLSKLEKSNETDLEIINIYKKILKIKPDKKEVYYELADFYGRKDAYNKALVYADKALEIDNTYFSANEIKSRILMELEKYEEALNAINQAIKVKPNNIEAYLTRGEIYTKLAMFNKARNDFFEIIDNLDINISNDPYAYLSYIDLFILEKRFSKADELLSFIEKTFKNKYYDINDESEFHMVKYRKFSAQNNFVEALNSINNAINKSSDNKIKYSFEKINLYLTFNKCKGAVKTLDFVKEKAVQSFRKKEKIESYDIKIAQCK